MTQTIDTARLPSHRVFDAAALTRPLCEIAAQYSGRGQPRRFLRRCSQAAARARRAFGTPV